MHVVILVCSQIVIVCSNVEVLVCRNYCLCDLSGPPYHTATFENNNLFQDIKKMCMDGLLKEKKKTFLLKL